VSSTRVSGEGKNLPKHRTVKKERQGRTQKEKERKQKKFEIKKEKGPRGGLKKKGFFSLLIVGRRKKDAKGQRKKDSRRSS